MRLVNSYSVTSLAFAWKDLLKYSKHPRRGSINASCLHRGGEGGGGRGRPGPTRGFLHAAKKARFDIKPKRSFSGFSIVSSTPPVGFWTPGQGRSGRQMPIEAVQVRLSPSLQPRNFERWFWNFVCGVSQWYTATYVSSIFLFGDLRTDRRSQLLHWHTMKKSDNANKSCHIRLTTL